MRMSSVSVRVMAGYLSKPGGQVRSERVKVGPWPQLTVYCLSRALYAAACWAWPDGCYAPGMVISDECWMVYLSI